jgi:hypothetical protein
MIPKCGKDITIVPNLGLFFGGLLADVGPGTVGLGLDGLDLLRFEVLVAALDHEILFHGEVE